MNAQIKQYLDRMPMHHLAILVKAVGIDHIAKITAKSVIAEIEKSCEVKQEVLNRMKKYEEQEAVREAQPRKPATPLGVITGRRYGRYC